MSEEKTEQPTEQRLDESRKDGNVAQRKNIQETAVLTLGVFTIIAIWPTMARQLGALIDLVILGVENGFANVIGDVTTLGYQIIVLQLSFAAGLGLFLLFFSLLINKFNFAPKALKPKFEKLNPITGLKGVFSVTTLYNFFRILFFFSAVSIIAFFFIWKNMGDVIQASRCGPRCLAMIFPPIFLQMVFIILLLLIVLSALDFKLQNMIFIKQNKMTKDQVKRETKQATGDPVIKSKRKQLADEDSVMPTLHDVTHVVYSSSALVALIYYEGELPFVVAKMKGPKVAKLQKKFRSIGTPCVNLPSVANEFHRMAPVGNYLKSDAATGMYKIIKACEGIT